MLLYGCGLNYVVDQDQCVELVDCFGFYVVVGWMLVIWIDIRCCLCWTRCDCVMLCLIDKLGLVLL